MAMAYFAPLEHQECSYGARIPRWGLSSTTEGVTVLEGAGGALGEEVAVGDQSAFTLWRPF